MSKRTENNDADNRSSTSDDNDENQGRMPESQMIKMSEADADRFKPDEAEIRIRAEKIVDFLLNQLQHNSRIFDETKIVFVGNERQSKTQKRSIATATVAEGTNEDHQQFLTGGSSAVLDSVLYLKIYTGPIQNVKVLSTMMDILKNDYIGNNNNSMDIIGQRRLRAFTTICFCHFDFDIFPRHLSESMCILFPSISHGHVMISDCPNICSIIELLIQFPNIASLDINSCPMYKSILGTCTTDQKSAFMSTSTSFLSNLCLIKIDNCGLVVKDHENEWDGGMEILGKSPSRHENPEASGNDVGDNNVHVGRDNNRHHSHNELEIILRNCNEIERLPDCIQHLSKTLHTLILQELPQFTKLPSSIGLLKSLKLLTIVDATVILFPPEIGRLRDDCEVAYINMQTNTDGCSEISAKIYPPMCHRGSIVSMRRYFTICRAKAFWGWIRLAILFRKARERANERLFSPGGRGYKRCRDHFSEATRNRDSMMVPKQLSSTSIISHSSERNNVDVLQNGKLYTDIRREQKKQRH